MELTFTPLSRGEPFTCRVVSGAEDRVPMTADPGMFSHIVSPGYLLSNQPYELYLRGPFRQEPVSLSVRIDSETVGRAYTEIEEDGIRISFLSGNKPLPVFENCYGLSWIKLIVRYRSGETDELYSDFITVLLPNTPANQSLRLMAEYVYRNYAGYLLNGHEESPENEQITFGTVDNMDSQIRMIREVVRVYSQNLPLFKTNAHTKAESCYSVQDINRMHMMTPRTLRYMETHPDDLARSRNGTGIRVGDKSYIPRKTLVLSTEQSRETYENQMVFNFLYTVQEMTVRLKEQALAYAGSLRREYEVEGYISSAEVIMSSVKDRLLAAHNELKGLSAKITELFWTYQSFLGLEASAMLKVPEYTGVFRSVRPYHQVFRCMFRWFSRGAYGFDRECFILPLMYNHLLYEYYMLTKLIKLIEHENYRFDREKSCCFTYPLIPRQDYDPDHYNTLVFSDGTDRITLYYQPVVWGQRYRDQYRNGISLRRSTSYEYESSKQVGNNAFFTPDYIIKYQHGTEERYLILDAKYTTRNKFYEGRLQEIIYKYLFGIHAVDQAKCVGVCCLYGNACQEQTRLVSLQDIYCNENDKDFWVSSLSEGNSTEEQQFAELKKLILRLKGKGKESAPKA